MQRESQIQFWRFHREQWMMLDSGMLSKFCHERSPPIPLRDGDGDLIDDAILVRQLLMRLFSDPDTNPLSQVEREDEGAAGPGAWQAPSKMGDALPPPTVVSDSRVRSGRRIVPTSAFDPTKEASRPQWRDAKAELPSISVALPGQPRWGQQPTPSQAAGAAGRSLKAGAGSDDATPQPSSSPQSSDAGGEDGQDQWDDLCLVCNSPGNLICCEAARCGAVYHLSCAGLSSVPTVEWHCELCRQSKGSKKDAAFMRKKRQREPTGVSVGVISTGPIREGEKKIISLHEIEVVHFFSADVREKMRRNTRARVDSDTPELSEPPSERVPPIAIKDTGVGCKGWGGFSARALTKGEFLGEYVGEVIDDKELRNRESGYIFKIGGGLSIDGERFGNAMRFLNHSSAPNCRAQVINHIGTRRVVFSAIDDIQKGEELCYDYGEEWKNDFLAKGNTID